MALEDVKNEIETETASIKKEIQVVGSIDEEAALSYILERLQISVIELAEFKDQCSSSGNPGPNEELIDTFSDAVAGLNSMMSRLAVLAERVTTKTGRRVLDLIRNFFTKRVMRIMPHIAGALKLQSWSLGISAAGFASLTFTFGLPDS